MAETPWRIHAIDEPSDTFDLEDEAPATRPHAIRRALQNMRNRGEESPRPSRTRAAEKSGAQGNASRTNASTTNHKKSSRFAKGAVVAAVLALGIIAVPAMAQGNPISAFVSNAIVALTGDKETVIENHKVPAEMIQDPDGTTITLYDYWDTEDHKNGDDHLGEGQGGTVRYEGINYDYEKKINNQFEFNQGGHGQEALSINCSGNALRRQLVQGVLDSDGYPVMGGKGTKASEYRDGSSGAINEKPLAYLFNNEDVAGKAVYNNAAGLLQVDSDGYYYYDSTKNFASYNSTTQKFDLYDAPAVQPNGNTPFGQFFPFDAATEVFDGTVNENNKLNAAAGVKSIASTATGSPVTLNHWFGLNMTTQFTQTNNGIASTGKPVTFEFSGDDDVWVFIDGVLVGDMGGIHSARKLSINFKTGEVNADGTTTTIRECFANAAKTYSAQGYTYDESDFSGDTFANNTVHTLKFFYLERGNWDSNMSLKFNLTKAPVNGVKKVDENGNGIGGVTFGLYPADDKHQPQSEPAAKAETADDGTLSFIDSDTKRPLTFSALHDKYKTEHFVLKEIPSEDRPEGYRTAGSDIRIRYNQKTGAIYCENYWLTGAFAPTGEIITAPRTMQVTKDPASNTYDQTLTVGEDGLSLKDGTAGGILFAAVLHKNSNDTSGNTWNAVYGTREEGDWRVTDEDASTYDAVCDAITKAKEQNERATWVFSKGSTND